MLKRIPCTISEQNIIAAAAAIPERQWGVEEFLKANATGKLKMISSEDIHITKSKEIWHDGNFIYQNGEDYLKFRVSVKPNKTVVYMGEYKVNSAHVRELVYNSYAFKSGRVSKFEVETMLACEKFIPRHMTM